jgi:uncharacterized protein YcbK (DUF882 family)
MNAESMADFSSANTKIMCKHDVISINRYQLRYRGMTTVLSLLLILIPLAASAVAQQERTLSFYNTHTRERLAVIYKRHGKYVLESLEKINYILRDHRSGDVHPIDPKLLDYLYDLLTEVGNHGEVHIISGYRSPQTNQKLRRRSKGVAKGSQHLQGKALDFRLPGTDTAVLRDAARKMKRGGVGYYRKSDFIQIDTGRVRYW